MRVKLALKPAKISRAKRWGRGTVLSERSLAAWLTWTSWGPTGPTSSFSCSFRSICRSFCRWKSSEPATAGCDRSSHTFSHSDPFSTFLLPSHLESLGAWRQGPPWHRHAGVGMDGGRQALSPPLLLQRLSGSLPWRNWRSDLWDVELTWLCLARLIPCSLPSCRPVAGCCRTQQFCLGGHPPGLEWSPWCAGTVCLPDGREETTFVFLRSSPSPGRK